MSKYSEIKEAAKSTSEFLVLGERIENDERVCFIEIVVAPNEEYKNTERVLERIDRLVDVIKTKTSFIPYGIAKRTNAFGYIEGIGKADSIVYREIMNNENVLQAVREFKSKMPKDAPSFLYDKVYGNGLAESGQEETTASELRIVMVFLPSASVYEYARNHILRGWVFEEKDIK